MEGKGYADAADWVYRQAIQPGGWQPGSILNLTEVRQVHRTAMTPVWDVEPHPDAIPNETPGNFREHKSTRFPLG
jgi:hypothetical protein